MNGGACLVLASGCFSADRSDVGRQIEPPRGVGTRSALSLSQIACSVGSHPGALGGHPGPRARERRPRPLAKQRTALEKKAENGDTYAIRELREHIGTALPTLPTSTHWPLTYSYRRCTPSPPM